MNPLISKTKLIISNARTESDIKITSGFFPDNIVNRTIKKIH